MSGRLANIVPISGNYPVLGKAWDSTAKRVPGAGYLTPKTAGSSQEMNDLVGANQDAILALANQSGQHAALNWPVQSTDLAVPGSGPTFTGCAWDVKYGRWLVYGVKSGTVNAGLAYASSNGGRTWFAFGGANPSSGAADGAIVGVVFNPTTGKLAVATWQGAGGSMDPAALTDEESRLHVNSVSGKVVGIAFNGLYIFLGRNNNTTPLLVTSPLGSSGTWTSRTSFTLSLSVPNTWCGGASDYALASSGTAVMCVALGATNYGEYGYSTDGTTYVVRTHPTASGWANTGLCWSTDRWVISQTNATDSRIIYSLDGTNWTTLTPATLSFVSLGGVSSIGALLFAAAYTHLAIRGAWSVDGGTTWQFGGQYDMTLATALTPDRSYSNGAQFGTVSINRVGFSAYMATPGIQGY